MKLKIRHVVAYFFLITLIATGVSFSRFSTVLMNTGAENTELQPIEFSTWKLDFNSETLNLLNMVPGETRTSVIKVRNYKDGKVSDYDQGIRLEIVSTRNLPLVFRLWEGETQISLNPNGSGDGFYSQMSAIKVFEGKITEEKTYTLQVLWPDDKASEVYKDEIDYVELRLEAKQL